MSFMHEQYLHDIASRAIYLNELYKTLKERFIRHPEWSDEFRRGYINGYLDANRETNMTNNESDRSSKGEN